MPPWKYCFLLTLLLCSALSTFAQQADFLPDKISGCSPLTVSFHNTSTGFSSSATYNWDFGNTNSSALKEPGTTYKDEGLYTVTLTVTDDGKSWVKSSQITVYKKPVVDFSVDVTTGCAPLAVNFTSNSTPGDGTISNYTWDFGDGNAQAGAATQNHIYNIGKTVSPSLTVTNSYGCYNTLSMPSLIKVLPSVSASFKTPKTVVCSVQDGITFNNTSVGEGAIIYTWDFGDGTTTDAANPRHTYKQKGTYTIKLTAKNESGCQSDTIVTNYLNVADFHTGFTVPASICQNTTAVFTDTSKPLPTAETWLINNVPATDTAGHQLSHIFSASGDYKLTLFNKYDNCPDTATQTVSILPSPATTGFIANVLGDCGAPVTVEFKDTTKNANNWQWDFTGSGVFSGSGQTVNYQYPNNGTYNVTLKSTAANGCSAEISQPVTVNKLPVSIGSSNGDYGCQTMTTVFSAITGLNIASYNWNFGDGTTSTEAKPQHTYSSPGAYTVTLQYVSAGGCAGTATYSLQVYEKPKFDFTAVPGTTVCGNNPVGFTVTGENLVGTFSWNFGDINQYGDTIAPFAHVYEYDSVFTVSLIINNHGCADTVTKTNYITVYPPFPRISLVQNTCDGDRGLVNFEEKSRKAKTFSWNFGDGSAPYAYSVPTRPSDIPHHYAATGAYHVVLTTSNGACSAVDSAIAYVLVKQTPVLSAANAKICSSDILHTNVGSLDENPATGSDSLGYTIASVEYSDGAAFGGSVSLPQTWQNPFAADISGVDVNKTTFRIITSSQFFGCADTTNYLDYLALGPVADFSVMQNNRCFKTPVVFKDQSKPSHNSPIVKWEWHFGDSLSQTASNGNNVTHLYAEPQTYAASLTVTDANHCTATTPDTFGIVTLTGPKASFSLSENTILPQNAIYFYNYSNTINTNPEDNKYTWHFGDGESRRNEDFADSVTHIYKTKGVDTIVLIANNVAEHCADTAKNIVYVRNPDLNFTYTTTYVNPTSGCPPVIGNFISTSLNTTSISWNFGDSSTGDNDIASHIYEKPGIYKVTLYGHFIDGSVDSIFQMITIKGPYATLQTSKDFACGPDLITLKAATTNSKNFTWDFGDGTLVSNSDTFAGHHYLTPGVYTPSLIVSDSNNCKFPYFLAKPIVIDTLHLAINIKAEIACSSQAALFTPDVVSEAKTELGLPLSYHWNFGTGKNVDTAATEESSFTYNTPGTYKVMLTGASPYGCTDTTFRDVVVQQTPAAAIKGPVKICQDDSASFTGESADNVTWHWIFQNNKTSDVQNPPTQQFTIAGTDSIALIVNENGCFDTSYHSILVNAKPVVNPSPLSAHLCEGDSVQLQAHDGINYQWTPNQHITGANTDLPYVFPDTATTYFVKVTNEAGCSSYDSVMIDVTKHFTLTAASPVYICPGNTAQLQAYGADVYHWLSTDVSNTEIANPTTSVFADQIYTVAGSDRYGCFTDTTSMQVLTATLPTVNAGEDLTTFAGNAISLTATGSPDIVKWQWLPSNNIACDTCAVTRLTPHSDMQYVIKATNSRGCVSYDSVHVSILCKTSLVNIPSAFTPNGDGKNDRFTVLGSGIKQIKHFAVFDRYGEPLFETSNFDVGESAYSGWDGTYNNRPMPPGTYVYIADLICDTGELFRYKGTVVLIR